MKGNIFLKTRLIVFVIFIFITVIGTGGFFFFKTNVSNIIPPKNVEIFLAKKDICTILFMDDEIWAGGATGLFVLRPEKSIVDGKAEYKVSEIGKLRYVRDLIVFNGQILVAYDEGILVVEEDKPEKFEAAEYLPDKRTNALFVDTEGLLWAGTWGGAVVFEGSSVKQIYTKDEGIAADMVNKIFEDSYGNIWIGSYVAPKGGISIIDKDRNGEIFTFTVEKGLLHSNINDIIHVGDSDVFVGGGLYNRGGITKFSYNGTNWDIGGYIQKSDGLAGEKVRSMMLDSKSKLWLGSEYDGLAIFNLKNGMDLSEVITTKDGLSHNEIKVMKEDKFSNIWLGTLKGLVKIEKGEFK